MSKRITAPVLPHVAAIYTRVSSKAQAGDDKSSLRTQAESCHAKARADGYIGEDVVTVYTDQHTGEELHERPGLTALREAAKRHAFAALYVHSTDRLSRDPIHLGIVLEEMARAGIAVVFVTEPLDDSPEAALVRYIQGYAGKLENARRRERSMRSRTARAVSGKPIPGPRANYGLQWADVRDAEGRLLRVRWERHPLTAPVVERLWQTALGSGAWTLRGLATQLTREGVPTPTRVVWDALPADKQEHILREREKRGIDNDAHPPYATEWDATTVRQIYTNSVYWGEPRALRHLQVPVELKVRNQYAHKSRATRRDPGATVALPADTAPAFVTPEQAAEVHRRMGLHQSQGWHEGHRGHERDGRHPHEALLRGGIARCGYCHYALYVGGGSPTHPAVVYRCRKLAVRAGGCSAHSITVARLDRAVWARFALELRDPVCIRDELARMDEMERRGETPGADVLANLEAQIAGINRRIKNKRSYVEMVDDDDERTAIAAAVRLLIEQRTALEAERANTTAHFASWQADRDALLRVLDWCERVSGNLDAFTFDQRRTTLQTLRAEVLLYKKDRHPRVELTFSLPLSGTSTLTDTGLPPYHSDEKFLVLT